MVKFIEETQPNWWQLPKGLRETLLASEVGSELANLFETTPPFSQSIGKEIAFPELGTSVTDYSGADILRSILVSYLFAAGERGWKPKAFNRVWNDSLSYFNPSIMSVEYCLYAPIANMPGVRRSLDLGNGLSIRRLSADERTRLATLDPILAGVNVAHRHRQWPGCFLVNQLHLTKRIGESPPFVGLMLENPKHKWSSQINEETAILRCLLSEEIAVPTFSFIRDGYPRDIGWGSGMELPWRARIPYWMTPPSKEKVTKYKHRRAKFLKFQASPGWASVAASMRRFAIAWENPFRVDILADLVAALEHLMVRGDAEVSYKLRTRTSQFLGKSSSEKQRIVQNLKSAYSYRSKSFHGGFVFDDLSEFLTAKRLKGAKGKQGNPFHDVNEVNRLIGTVSGYYRSILETIIDRGEFEINWEKDAL